eukprot:554123-Ditylum_brightwellii.AAC.1
MFVTRATIHSTSRATPAQLVIRRDAMLNLQHEANWTYIKEHRAKISSKNNNMQPAHDEERANGTMQAKAWERYTNTP